MANKLLAIDSMIYRYIIEEKSEDIQEGIIAIMQAELQIMAEKLQAYSNSGARVLEEE